MAKVSQGYYPGVELRKERTKRPTWIVASLLLLLISGVNALAQVNVYTRSYDNSRTGDNLQETVLTKANVNANNFGKLFTVHTDGQIFAQPLYVSNLTVGGAVHNVVFAASMRNTVYAIDADSGTVLWSQNYGTPIVPQDVESDQNVSWSTGLGILSTPVIDPATNYMYFVAGIQPAGTYNISYQLNAIDITTGLPVHGSPITIAGSYQTADLTSPIVFNAIYQNARPGLGLANGNVYIAFSSHEDNNYYHGFIFAYSTSTLAQTAVYSDTTIGVSGGIWQAGQAPVIDASGNVYYSTGNGSYGVTPNNLVQTSQSFIKLTPNLQLLDYFTPYNSGLLNGYDWDLGAGGLMLIPNTQYVAGGGKEGVLYLADTTNLGHYNASADQVHQEFQAVYGNGTSHIHGGPVYYNSATNGPTLYVWGENDVLRAFQYNATTALLNTTPFATSTMTAPATNASGAMPGGFLGVTANGNANGIVWASTPYNADALKANVQGVLYAFDAETLKVLWTDKTNDARDDVGLFAKNVPPVVANGKMYVPDFGALGTTDGSGNLLAYGLLLPPLTVSVNNATMTAGSALPTFTGTVTGLENGDTVGTTVIVTYSTTATTNSPAGTYPITATVTGSSAGNYSVTVTAGTLTITAAQKPTLTVTANNATRVYNTANPAFTGTVTGQQNGDTFTETFATTATQASNVGTYAIVPTAAGANLANYTVTTNNGTLTITQATQTINFPAIAAHTYPSSPFAVTATSSAGTNYPVTITVQSGPATIANGTVTLTGAGTVTLLASQAGDQNTSAATATQTFAVTAAPTLTVAANNATRAYNTANPAFAGTVTGQQNGDTFTETFTTTATTTSPVGTYAIVPTASGTDLGNYNVVTNNGTLTVTQASQTITFGAIGAQAYGTPPFAVTATSSAGAAYPVTITVQSGPATIAGGTVTLTGAGTVVLKGSQAGDTNYAAATATQSFAVTQAQLTATANSASRGYNTANPTFTGTVTGAVGSDTFTETFTTTATTASNVGTYSIVPAVSGANLANYKVNAVNGTLTVTAAATTTTLSAPATASSGNSVALTATVASTAGTPGGIVTFFSGATPLGTGTLNASGAATLSTTTLAIGTDSVTASYPATGNFAASTSAPASINVSAASQTITFPAITSKVYGSTPFAVSATSSLGSSYPVTVTVQSGPASITGGMVSLNAVGTVVLLATQAGDSAHAAASAMQSFQVIPAALTVAAANASRAFGAANPTFTGTVTGAVGSDTFTETFTTTAISSSNAGTYPIVPAVTGPTANYTVTLTNGTLTVTGAATATTVSAPSTANSGASVTITATVASSAGTPGGTVTFTSGSTALGTGTLSGGTASVNTTALPAGADTVTATYAAAGNFAGSSGTATVNVAAPPTSIPGSYAVSASPTSLSIKVGTAGNTMLTLTPSGGYTGTIALSCTGLPANASCSFAQNQIQLTGNNQAVTVGLTITTASPASALAMRGTPSSPGLLAVAFYWPGALTGMAVFLRKRKAKMPRLAQLCLLLLCTCAFAAGLSGCGMTTTISTQNAQVTVVAKGTATSGTVTQSATLSLTVTP